LVEEAAAAAVDHPGQRLLDYLNGQLPHSLVRRINGNWPRLVEAAERLPEGPQKEATYRALHALIEDVRMIYRPVKNSARLFTAGLGIHGLPRELRMIALCGDTTLDLRSCQLAVVSQVWDLPFLRELLEREPSFWKWMLDQLGLPATYKQVLKTTTYSILFGMTQSNLRRRLEGAMSEEVIESVMTHPLVTELFRARTKKVAEVRAAGGGYDTFGNWLAVTPERKPHQVVCSIVQSYELQLMLPVLDIVADNPDVHLHSWLHDSITLAIRRDTQKDKILRLIMDSVARTAKTMGIPTQLEIN
jgi:hypothetical protein